MGQTIRVLAEKKLPLERWSAMMRFVSAETIHVYWRNVRVVFDLSQFRIALKNFSTAVAKWIGIGSPYGKGDILLMNELIRDTPEEICVVVEEVQGDVVHIHYGDVRFEMCKENFVRFAQCLCEAKENI